LDLHAPIISSKPKGIIIFELSQGFRAGDNNIS
jgi:hypothetical protein